MAPLWIRTVEVPPDVTVLEMAGRFVMGDNRRVEDVVIELLGKDRKKIVLDLSRVDYIDSSGMGSIAYCLAKSARIGATLRISGLADRLMPLFRMTRLESIIAFYPNVSAAAGTPW